ncbi:TPA: ATP-binding protein, partial [Bacillus thuringiensis]|nr:ATP-binding protein [Bacillus thuringiensis]
MYSIEIEGLFGDRDVKFTFNKPLLILIGENGVGKSTVLGILNYILEKNLAGLKEYEFDLIKFTINKKSYFLYRSELEEIPHPWEVNYELLNHLMKNDRSIIRSVARELEMPLSMFERYVNEGDIEFIYDRIVHMKSRGADTSLTEKLFSTIENEKHKNLPLIRNFIDPIRSELKGELLYFPTYRRVEEEAYKLGQFIDRDLGKNVIKFGMQDVQNIFDNIIDQIKTETINGVQNVMDSLFTNLLSELNLSNEYNSSDLKNKREDLEIILQRSE